MNVIERECVGGLMSWGGEGTKREARGGGVDCVFGNWEQGIGIEYWR